MNIAIGPGQPSIATMSAAHRNTVACILFAGFGVFSFVYLVDLISRDLKVFALLLVSALLTIAIVVLSSIVLESKSANKWARIAIPFLLCLFVYAMIVKSVGKLGRYPTPDLTHQLGLRYTVFFAVLFGWILIATMAGRPRDVNPRLLKVQFVVTGATAFFLVTFAIYFLRGVWSAASTEQLRSSMKALIYMGMTVYFFIVARVFLLKITFSNRKVTEGDSDLES